ncbi:MAG: hypothetical protein O2856_01930 [Planctomycetota bacterium]|nr:hypothetical protein [Planctomycetota bacterium]
MTHIDHIVWERQAVLNDVAWQSRLVIMENQIEGHLAIDSRLDQLEFTASDDIRPKIIEAANEAFSSMQTLNASVRISGTFRKPDIELHSDVGEQIAAGVKFAFAHQLDLAKAKLMAEVSDYADQHIQALKNRFAAEYTQLLEENQDLITKASEVRTLVADLRSGNMDARGLVRSVSSSSLINEKDRDKINGTMEKVDSVFSGQIPSELQKKIPQLPADLPFQPGILPFQSGNLPLQSGSFRSLLPTRPKQFSSQPKTLP